MDIKESSKAPQRRECWLDSANDPAGDFPLENLPFGVFEGDGANRIGLAIGDRILDLAGCAEAGLLEGLAEPVLQACGAEDLNALARTGTAAVRAVARPRNRTPQQSWSTAQDSSLTLSRRKSARMRMPFRIGDYTDFYASIHHATNVGRLFRPDTPLLPNYKWVPDRLSRAGFFDRGQRDRDSSAIGPEQIAGYVRTHV